MRLVRARLGRRSRLKKMPSADVGHSEGPHNYESHLRIPTALRSYRTHFFAYGKSKGT